ncbi:TPA: EpsG family protein [Photobacterium damselae]
MYWLFFLIIFLILTFLSLTLNRYNRFFYGLSLSIFLISLIVGYFNGMDFANYYYGFLDHTKYSTFLTDREPLFELLFFYLDKITVDFYLSIIIYYILMLYLMFKIPLGSEDFKFNGSLFLLAIFLLCSVELYGEQIRQAMSMTLIIIYISNYMFKDNKKYILLFLACLFHYSSILVIIVIFISDRIKTKKKTLLALIIIMVSSYFVLFNLKWFVELASPFLNEKMSFKILFFIDKMGIKFRFGFFGLLNLIIIFMVLKYGKFKDSKLRFILNGVLLTSVLQISFYIFPIGQRFISTLIVFYIFCFVLYVVNPRLSSKYIPAILFVYMLSFFLVKDMQRDFFIDTPVHFFNYLYGDLNIDSLRQTVCSKHIHFCRN